MNNYKKRTKSLLLEMQDNIKKNVRDINNKVDKEVQENEEVIKLKLCLIPVLKS